MDPVRKLRQEMAHSLRLVAEQQTGDATHLQEVLDRAPVSTLVQIADQLDRKFEVRLVPSDETH